MFDCSLACGGVDDKYSVVDGGDIIDGIADGKSPGSACCFDGGEIIDCITIAADAAGIGVAGRLTPGNKENIYRSPSSSSSSLSFSSSASSLLSGNNSEGDFD